MTRVTVLGGCGAVGNVVVRTLAGFEDFSEVLIADMDMPKANKIAAELGNKVSAVKLDATDSESIKAAVQGSDVVVNCVGPFYVFEKTILSTIIDLGINYVDINDDTGATYDALDMHEAAKKADITALIGMGSSPGATNLLAKFAATILLKETDSIDLYHAHGGEPEEGAAVIGHRFYCMRQDVPVFIDGKAKNLTQKEAESLREEVEFINLKGKHLVYPYPHPEPITMPRFIKGLKRVTNKGTVLPNEYYELTRKIHECGLDGQDPVVVKGQEILPYDFAIAYLIKRRDEILKETNFGEARGCVKIVVSGKSARKKPHTYIFSLASEGVAKGQAMGEGTGIPAAMGAVLMIRGKIKEKGVLPPEACVNPMEFMSLMQEVLKVKKVGGEGSPLIIESIDEAGNVKRMTI